VLGRRLGGDAALTGAVTGSGDGVAFSLTMRIIIIKRFNEAMARMVGSPRGIGQSFSAFAEQRHGEVDVCSESGEMKRPEVRRCPLGASDGHLRQPRGGTELVSRPGPAMPCPQKFAAP
jgi:hypothetical protein